jgi:hypothetical protein
MAAVLQPKNDAVFLNGRHSAEQVRLFQPRGKRFVAERFDLGAGQHRVDWNAEFAADMLRYALVVPAEDLDADTRWCTKPWEWTDAPSGLVSS